MKTDKELFAIALRIYWLMEQGERREVVTLLRELEQSHALPSEPLR